MNKRDNLPDNWITPKQRYTEIINNNDIVINRNNSKIEDLENKIKSLEDEQLNKIKQTQEDYNQSIIKEKNENLKSIILFLCISTIIEFVIIFGVYYRKYYIYKSYDEYKSEFEPILNKINKYKNLIKIIYKNGRIGIGDSVLGNKQLIQELIDLGFDYSDSLVTGFYKEMQLLNNLKWHNNEWHTLKDYKSALRSISETEKDYIKQEQKMTTQHNNPNSEKSENFEEIKEENVQNNTSNSGTAENRLNQRIGRVTYK